MKLKIFGILVLAIASGAYWLLDVYLGGDQLYPPPPPPVVREVPDNWPEAREKRLQAIDQHLEKYQVAYQRFANFPTSETDGIPFIILKLLPVVAPEYWGKGDDFLQVMGLFQDERLQGSPLPRGIGFSGLSRQDALGNIDYSSFACGGCHIGRVRLPDGSMQYLDGGINTQFNVIGFRKRLTQTLTKIYQGETDPDKKQTVLIETFLNALEQSQTKDPHFFYRNYQFEGRHFDAEYEKAQIALFKQQARSLSDLRQKSGIIISIYYSGQRPQTNEQMDFQNH